MHSPRTAARIAFSLVLLGAIGACAEPAPQQTPDAGAIPQDQAAAEVLEVVVQPDSLDHELIVFALRTPVSESDRLEPYHLPGTPEPEPVQDLPAEAWFFWIDDYPGAKFAHPTRFVLVDRQTGEIQVMEQEWWPVLNGEGLWVETADYWDESNWAFSNVSWRRSGASAAPALTRWVAQAVRFTQTGLPPSLSHRARQATSPGTAIVINGWSPGETLQEDFEADADMMHDIFDDVGFDTTYLGPSEDDNPDRSGEPDYGSMYDAFWDAAQNLQASQTLFVYVTGHGSNDGGEGRVDGVSESALQRWLEGVDPGVHVIVILDSCHTGSFIDGLVNVSDIVITATDADSFSYGDYDPEWDPNPTDYGSEFTSGFVEDWNRILDDYEETQRVSEDAKATGRNFWEALAEASFHTAFDKDAAQIEGLSLPLIDFGARVSADTSLDGTYPASTEIKEDERNHGPHVDLWTEGELYITTEAGMITIGGMPPWVPVIGPITPDGDFTAQGYGSVAGFSDILVTFEGSILQGVLLGEYGMGMQGGLPGGVPIIFTVQGQRLIEPVTVEPASPVDEFLGSYNQAFQTGDAAHLLESLHPLALGLYGAEACLAYMQSVIETPVQVELLTSSEPGPWTWEIDGVSIAVEQAVAVEVSFTAQGETSEQQIHLAALEDGSLGWFSDCGDPTLIPPPLVAMALDGGFTVCGSGCSLREKIVEAQTIHVWCMNDSACTSRGCACHLYSLGPGGSPQDPDDWEYETEAGDKILKDNNRDYHCFCVR